MSVIGSKYRVESSLGHGTFGQVVLARDIETSRKVAIKVCSKAEGQLAQNLVQEIETLSRLDHQNIVRLFEVFEDDQKIYIVLEYVPGGELFDYIATHNRVREKEGRDFFLQIARAIQYVHEHNIVHRDLKPENILIDLSHNIKIIDFGLAYFINPDQQVTGKCGSPHYTSPEMLDGKSYGPGVDMWSLGVILFALLCGYLPFDDSSRESLIDSIRNGRYYLPKWLSEQVRDLLSRLLQVNPELRITANEVVQHVWLTSPSPPSVSLEQLLGCIMEEESRLAEKELVGDLTGCMPRWQLMKERRIAENVVKRKSVIDMDLKGIGQGTVTRPPRQRALSMQGFGISSHNSLSQRPQSPAMKSGVLQPLPALAEVDEETESAAAQGQTVPFSLYAQPSGPQPPQSRRHMFPTGMTEAMEGITVGGRRSPTEPAGHGPVRRSRSRIARRLSEASIMGVPPLNMNEDDGDGLPVVHGTPGAGPTWAVSPTVRFPSRSGTQRAPSYTTLPFPESAVTNLKPEEIMGYLKEVLEALQMEHVEWVGPFSVIARTAKDLITDSAVELQISVFRLSNLAGMHVIVGHRRHGDVWLYCALFQSVIEMFTAKSGNTNTNS